MKRLLALFIVLLASSELSARYWGPGRRAGVAPIRRGVAVQAVRGTGEEIMEVSPGVQEVVAQPGTEEVVVAEEDPVFVGGVVRRGEVVPGGGARRTARRVGRRAGRR